MKQSIGHPLALEVPRPVSIEISTSGPDQVSVVVMGAAYAEDAECKCPLSLSVKQRQALKAAVYFIFGVVVATGYDIGVLPWG